VTPLYDSQSSVGKAENVALDRLKQVPTAQAELRMGRSFMRRTTSAIASLDSVIEKKVTPRSRPRMSVWANLTPASTFPLSWVFPSRIGSTPTK
jgi:hypothetical protein